MRWLLTMIGAIGVLVGLYFVAGRSTAVGDTEEQTSFDAYVMEAITGQWVARTEKGTLILAVEGEAGGMGLSTVKDESLLAKLSFDSADYTGASTWRMEVEGWGSGECLLEGPHQNANDRVRLLGAEPASPWPKIPIEFARIERPADPQLRQLLARVRAIASNLGTTDSEVAEPR